MATTSTSNSVEKELNVLIRQAQRLPCDELETCKDWTKQELARAKKLFQKIYQLQSSPMITSKLFNEARDCCGMLTEWMKRLEMNLIQTNCRSYNCLTDLGIANRTSTY